MELEFKDVQSGIKFTHNNIEYEKIPDERLSCCKVLNAINLDTKEKCMILPLEKVQVQSE